MSAKNPLHTDEQPYIGADGVESVRTGSSKGPQDTYIRDAVLWVVSNA